MDFEQIFFDSLPKEFFGKRILLGVSGGADSVAMLVCVSSLCEKTGIVPFVATVNHKIRCEAESGGDCDFVVSLCKKLNVECCVIEADENQIFSLSKERKKGVEEAARFFRYNSLKNACKNYGCDAIFLAHNKNDQEETLLQRFLQGSFKESSCGIPEKRLDDGVVFFRPLLSFTRAEILCYLEEKEFSYRTDSTNFDTAYFRNRIRQNLVPVLNENFVGWETAILNSAAKKSVDEDFFDSVLKSYEWQKSDTQSFFMDNEVFSSLHLALKIRLVYNALENLECDERISYQNIKKFCEGKNVSTCNIRMEYKQNKAFIRKENCTKNSGKDSVLFAIIEDEGEFSLGNYRISVVPSDKNFKENCKNGFVTDTKEVAKKYLKSLPFLFEVKNGKIKLTDLPSDKKNKFQVLVWKDYERF